MPKSKPPANSRAAWTDQEDRLLGTDRDSVIAERLGRAIRSVAVRRWSLGIAPFTPRGRPPREPQSELGAFIRKLRGETSVAAMAKKAKISADAWRAIEAEMVPGLKIPTLKKVAKALGVEPKKLLEKC